MDFKFPHMGAWEQVAGNQHLACAVARCQYWMAHEPLPTNIEELAMYYKKNYNVKGKGTAAQFILKYRQYVD